MVLELGFQEELHKKSYIKFNQEMSLVFSLQRDVELRDQVASSLVWHLLKYLLHPGTKLGAFSFLI